MTMAGSLRSGSKTLWRPKANAVRTAPSGAPLPPPLDGIRQPRAAGSFVLEDLFRAFGRGPTDVPPTELVDRLYELAFSLLVLFVFLEVVRVVKKLGVLGESCLILYPFAHVVAGAAIATRNACAFTVCPFRVVLGHSPKVPLRRGLRGPGRCGQHPAGRRCRCDQRRRPGRVGRLG